MPTLISNWDSISSSTRRAFLR